jgi:hypothetical protein
MSAAFQGFVMGQVTGDAQQYYAEKLIDSYMRKADDADGIMEGVVFRVRGDVVRASNNWVHVLKAATVSKAVAAGEVDPIRDWVRDEVVEASTTQFLKALGAAPSSMFVGALVASLNNVKESYDELEKQDCLKGIDMAYYGFLNDSRLRSTRDGGTPPGAVDVYIREYLRGGGNDPQGNPRALNRRHLQCFVDATLPESERVEVSSLGADAEQRPTDPVGWMDRTFGTVTDTLRSAADAAPGDTRIRTPVIVMLRDFNRRYDIELEARRLTRFRQSSEYRRFEATIEAMKASEAAAQWLCDRLASRDLADLAGPWMLQLTLRNVSGESQALDPVAFEVPESGQVLTTLSEPKHAFTLEGTVGAEKVDLGFLLRGYDDDLGAMVTVLNLDLDGRVESGLMSGQFDGQSIDWACALEGLFDEDAPPKRCGTVPVSGTWAAQRQ